LSGYNGGVEQITLDSDGRLKAGAGSVTLDATGVKITGGTSLGNFVPVLAKAVRWDSSGSTIGFLQGGTDPTYGNLLELYALTITAVRAI